MRIVAIIEIIETGWDRDRDSRIASSEKFGTLTAHLWSLLREESIRAAQYAKAK